ncbi:MAG: hypothetical protein RLY70_4411 [Planctomycetota bacterium]|jgi:hypothetical protein
MHDAVDWKIIDENPFRKVKTHKSSVKVNEFVPREVVDKLMKKANPVWQVKSMRVGVFLIILHSQFSIHLISGGEFYTIRTHLGKPGFLSREDGKRTPHENNGKTGPSDQAAQIPACSAHGKPPAWLLKSTGRAWRGNILSGDSDHGLPTTGRGTESMPKLDYRNIEQDPTRCGGQPVVGGTRIRVGIILGCYRRVCGCAEMK